MLRGQHISLQSFLECNISSHKSNFFCLMGNLDINYTNSFIYFANLQILTNLQIFALGTYGLLTQLSVFPHFFLTHDPIFYTILDCKDCRIFHIIFNVEKTQACFPHQGFEIQFFSTLFNTYVYRRVSFSAVVIIISKEEKIFGPKMLMMKTVWRLSRNQFKPV